MHTDKALSQRIVCHWLDILKPYILGDDSDEENIPLLCARVTKSTAVAIIFGDLDF